MKSGLRHFAILFAAAALHHAAQNSAAGQDEPAASTVPDRVVPQLSERLGQIVAQSEDQQTKQYRPESAADLAPLGRVFQYVDADTGWPQELRQQLADAGFEVIVPDEIGDDDVIVIREQKDARRGRGVVAVRRGAADDIFLQAPHRYFDSHTGEFALRGFAQSSVRAAFWNTVPREVVDCAHESTLTTLDVLTQEFAKTFPTGMVIQFHGFVTEKRRTAAAKEADVILSGGTLTPGAKHYNARLFLRRALPDFNVALFPVDVKELGATRNKQAQILPKPNLFLHVELSKTLRTHLLKHPLTTDEMLKGLFRSHRF